MNKPTLVNLQKIPQDHSDILVGEFEREVPFDVKRFYIIDNHGTTSSHHGDHALKETQQAYVSVNGSAEFLCLDVNGVEFEFKLTTPDTMLVLPGMIWRQVVLSPGTTLVCLTSKVFDTNDYVKVKSDFLRS